MADKLPISACIICYNEEKKIRRCLESVLWAQEIIVVDSFSTDKTFHIASEYTDKIYQHKWLGYIGQKNFIKNFATQEWILFIDADEEVSPFLREEIINEFSSGESQYIDGYEFPRIVKFMNRWIRHGDWYPDIKLRLFKRKKGRCTGIEPHDVVTVYGTIKRLKGPLYHYTYDDITDEINTLNKFSSIAACSKIKMDQKPKITDILIRPLVRFIKCYFLKCGFLDGKAGFIIATCNAFGVFLKYAKLWELQSNINTSDNIKSQH